MKVKFVPQNIEIEMAPGQSVLHAAQEHGVHIQSVCKGVPSCAECRVHLVEGEHNVLPPSPTELSLIGTAYFVDRRRLSCQLKCFGDVTIDLKEQIEKEQNATPSKRPRGALRNQDFNPDKSQAVHGNIILEGNSPVAPEANAEAQASGAGAKEQPVEKKSTAKGPKKVYEQDLSTAESLLFEQETRAALEKIKSQKSHSHSQPHSKPHGHNQEAKPDSPNQGQKVNLKGNNHGQKE